MGHLAPSRHAYCSRLSFRFPESDCATDCLPAVPFAFQLHNRRGPAETTKYIRARGRRSSTHESPKRNLSLLIRPRPSHGIVRQNLREDFYKRPYISLSLSLIKSWTFGGSLVEMYPIIHLVGARTELLMVPWNKISKHAMIPQPTINLSAVIRNVAFSCLALFN